MRHSDGVVIIMIVQDDFLNKLKAFGLNSYESKLWTALLSRGVSTAGELSDIANVPRSRAYDVLESLERKGIIVMKLGKPIKYVAVPPEEVLERVKKRIKLDSQSQIQTIENIKETELLDELKMLHNQGIELVDPTDLSGSFKGRDSIYNHLDLALKGAKKSVTIMTSSQGLIRKYEALKRSLKKASDRGVKIRIAAPLNKSSKTVLNDLDGVAEVRNIEELKARFCIVDGKEMTFMLLDDESVHPSYDAGVWVNTELFSGAVENMFDGIWKKLK